MSISDSHADREKQKFLEADITGQTGLVALNADGTSINPILTSAYAYDVNHNPIYIGRAALGSAKASAVWQIKKLTYSGNDVTDIQWAGGVPTFSNIWDNRASLSYS